MAALPTQRRIMKEDLKDAPGWIDNLLNPVNSFMDSVYRALNKSLTFQENITSQIRNINFQTRADYTSATPIIAGFETIQFVHSLKTKPFACLICQIIEEGDEYIAITDPVTLNWYEVNGTIFISYITGLKDSKNYKLTLLVL